jgi:hypothetical protein
MTSDRIRARACHPLQSRPWLNLRPADQLYFEQLKEKIVADGTLGRAAKANTVGHCAFDSNVVDRRETNEYLFRQSMNDDAFAGEVRRLLLPTVYDALRGCAE